MTMHHPDSGANVYVHIGEAALRGVVPTTPSSIAVLYRTLQGRGDPSLMFAGEVRVTLD